MMAHPETLPQHWVNRLGFALRRDLVQRFQDAGITATAEEWGAMLILSGGPCTPAQLSAQTLRDRTTLTRLLDRLVARGWVAREPGRKDRRRLTIRLTREGYEAQSDMARVAEGLVRDCNRGISSADLETTTLALRQMLENITGEAGTGGQE